MSRFPDAFFRGLRNIFDFAGRDTRSAFWFYVLGLVLAQQAINILAMIPLFLGIFQGMDGLAAQGNFSASSAGVFSQFKWFVVAAIVMALLGLLLLAAAVTRRLHDRGLSGWWGLMPVPFMFAGLAAFVAFTARMGDASVNRPDDRLFAAMFVNNAFYMLAIIALIVLLVQGSDPAPNRFGPPSEP